MQFTAISLLLLHKSITFTVVCILNEGVLQLVGNATKIIHQTWSDQTTLKIGDGTFLRGKPECRSQQKLEMCHHYRHSFIHSPHKGINAGSIIHPRELSSVSQSVTQRHLPIFAPICNLFICIIQSIECFCRQIAVQQHNTNNNRNGIRSTEEQRMLRQ